MIRKSVKQLPEQVQRVLKEANASPNKGNYTTYNHYKNLLVTMGLSPEDYQEAVRCLADVLRV